MIITRLEIKNFRNISYCCFEFDKNINIFIGDNAQGKTNLMEAIAICTGKNVRRVKEIEHIPFETNENISIKLWFNDSFRENIIEYNYTDSKKSIKLNGINMKETAEIYSMLKTVVFIPEHLTIISGPSEIRRNFLDEIAAMQNKIHLNKLSRYNKALKQKNNILRVNRNIYEIQELINSWNEVLATEGINITYGRLRFFNDLNDISKKIYLKLTDNKENLNMKYISSVLGGDDTLCINSANKDNLYNLFLNKYEKDIDEEIARKHTISGAHRDELMIAINGHDSKSFASQGQKRSVAVALKLAECELIRLKNNDNPIIILDDVLSELDFGRRNFILNNIENSQVFITCCNKSDVELLKNGKVWEVKNGLFNLS